MAVWQSLKALLDHWQRKLPPKKHSKGLKNAAKCIPKIVKYLEVILNFK